MSTTSKNHCAKQSKCNNKIILPEKMHAKQITASKQT
uniref:Uncharacterized protein n=1 Tax=Arundo donax TaxID=35708 RepID=A0A0A8XRW9_ARUDO